MRPAKQSIGATMNLEKTLVGIAASLVLGGATLSSAALAQTDGPPKRGGVLRTHMQGEPPNLDCQQTALSFAIQIFKSMYSGLVRYEERDYPKISGDLAESWTISPDG